MPKTGWRESSRDSESKSHPLWEGMNPNLFSLSQKPTLGPNHYDQEVWTVFQHDRWGPTTGLKGSTASTGRREMLGYHPTTPPSSEPPAVVWRQAEVGLQEITEQWRIQTKLGGRPGSVLDVQSLRVAAHQSVQLRGASGHRHESLTKACPQL